MHRTLTLTLAVFAAPMVAATPRRRLSHGGR